MPRCCIYIIRCDGVDIVVAILILRILCLTVAVEAIYPASVSGLLLNRGLFTSFPESSQLLLDASLVQVLVISLF